MALQLPKVAVAVKLDGQTITGASLSFTVTVNEQVAVFPAASVTRKVFKTFPLGKAEPLFNPEVCVVVAPAQLSAPTGAANVTVALQSPGFTVVTMLEGQVMVGIWLSAIVTVNEQLAEFPKASVVVKVLVVVPDGNKAPLANPAVWAVVGPAQLSMPTGAV